MKRLITFPLRLVFLPLLRPLLWLTVFAALALCLLVDVGSAHADGARLHRFALLVGANDGGAERAKLEKERAKLAADRDFFAKKLGNPQFVERAKPEVIEKDRAKLAELESALARLDAAIARG